MRKFLGEISKISSQVRVVFDNEDRTISLELTKSLERVLGTFVNFKYIFPNQLKKSIKLSRNNVFIFTTLSAITTVNIQKLSQKNYLIGFLANISQNVDQQVLASLHSLNRIVTTNKSDYQLLKKLFPESDIVMTPIALDLRPFLNMPQSEKDNHGVIFSSQSKTPSSKSKDQGKLEFNFNSQSTFTEQINFLQNIRTVEIKNGADPLNLMEIRAKAAKRIVLKEFQSEDIDFISHDFRNLKFEYIEKFFQGMVKKNKGKNIFVVPSDAGFFSFFNNFISIRAHWLGVHGFDAIEPEWSAIRIINFWQKKKFDSFCYGNKTQGNIFFKLFDTEIKEIKQDSNTLFLNSPIALCEPNLTNANAHLLYLSFGFKSWRQGMHRALGDIKPNQDIQKRIDHLFEEADRDEALIGLHIRHPSHAIEQPEQRMATTIDYIRVTNELVKSLNSVSKKYRVFLATDQQKVLEDFQNVFGENLLYFKDLTRIPVSESVLYESRPESEKLDHGFQIQHKAASNIDNWDIKLAKDVISDVWALAHCNFLIHGTSNIATAVCYVNPNLESIPIMPNDSLILARERVNLGRITSHF